MTNPAPPPLTLAQRMAMTIGALQKAAAARAAKDWSLSPMILVLWSYLNRVTKRFEALATRLRAGTLAPPRPRQKPAREREPSPRRPGLPQNFGWLLRRVPDAIHSRSQLQHLLMDPEMAALLAASPQAGRVLRPLCRMLGLGPGVETPPALFPPKVARKPKVQPNPVPGGSPAQSGPDPWIEDDMPLELSPAPA